MADVGSLQAGAQGQLAVMRRCLSKQQHRADAAGAVAGCGLGAGVQAADWLALQRARPSASTWKSSRCRSVGGVHAHSAAASKLA